MMEGRMYTPAQIAEHLQVVERTVYRWLDAGVLKGVKLGRIWRISDSALEAFLIAQAALSHSSKEGR